jgi:membrane fusion protein (multidrug efflux system)
MTNTDAEKAENAAGEPAGAPAEFSGTPSLARRLRLPLLIGVPILVILGGLFLYLTGGRYQSTDDAYIQSARVDVSANVAGRVIDLPVHENQRVKKGDILFRLDPAPIDTAAAQAAADLANAKQNLTGEGATYQQRTVELQAAQVTLAYQTKELARQKAMTASGVTSQAQLDAQVQAVAVAKANVAAAQQAQAVALSALGGKPNAPASDNPAVRTAQAALDRAKLNQSYTVIRAPQDGTVTKVEQLQVGDYINAAQPVFSLVAPRVWVEANFKEDQLTYMRPGQPATFKVDAYPGVVFHGRVQSLSPGTGSSFSLLPPENATGNWVKVVQRLPVRISIDNPPDDMPLHAGLSVTAKVDTAHKRHLFGGEKRPAERTVTTTQTTTTTQAQRAG